MSCRVRSEESACSFSVGLAHQWNGCSLSLTIATKLGRSLWMWFTRMSSTHFGCAKCDFHKFRSPGQLAL